MSSKSEVAALAPHLPVLTTPFTEELSSSDEDTTGPANWKRLCFPKKAKSKIDNFKKRYRLNECPRACLLDFEILGMVRFGAPKLFKVKHASNGTIHTMEVMAKNNYRQKLRMRLPIRAKKIQWALQTPFTAPLHFAFKTERHLFLVMEYARFGDLRQIMDSDRKAGFSENEVKFFTAQLILALEFLHAAKVLYRSVNPKHVSMYEDGYIKLSYFEKAKKLKGGRTKTIIRSEIEYRAPEIVVGDPYSYSADFWALGIFVYETLCRATPFQSTDSSNVCDNIVDMEPSFPARISEDAEHFMRKLLVKDPVDRHTKDLRVQTWFKDLNFEMLWKKAYSFDVSRYKPVEIIESAEAAAINFQPSPGETKRPGGIFKEF